MNGRALSRATVRGVRCGECGAAPGEHCRGVRGKPRASNHRERVEAAEAGAADRMIEQAVERGRRAQAAGDDWWLAFDAPFDGDVVDSTAVEVIE